MSGSVPLFWIALLQQRRLTQDDLYHLKAVSAYCGSCLALVLCRRTSDGRNCQRRLRIVLQDHLGGSSIRAECQAARLLMPGKFRSYRLMGLISILPSGQHMSDIALFGNFTSVLSIRALSAPRLARCEAYGWPLGQRLRPVARPLPLCRPHSAASLQRLCWG